MVQRIALSFGQVPETEENDRRGDGVAPVAQMQGELSRPLTTPTKKRPEDTDSSRRISRAEASTGSSSGEPRRRKRKEIDGDDQDGDYTPRTRSKKQNLSPGKSGHTPAGDTAKHAPSAPALNQNLAAGQENASTLPNRSKDKRPTTPLELAPEVQEMEAPQLASIMNTINDLVAKGIESGTLQPQQFASILYKGLNDMVKEGQKDLINIEDSDTENQINLPDSVLENELNERTRQPPFTTRLAQSIDRQFNNSSNQAMQDRPNGPPFPAAQRPAIKIRYSIIASRHPRLTKIRWPNCSLTEKPINVLFDEVAAFTSKKDIERIEFRLITSGSDSRVGITRDQNDVYEDMKKEFAQEVRDNAKRGNLEFDLWIEPDPTDMGASESESHVDMATDGVDLAFSL